MVEDEINPFIINFVGQEVTIMTTQTISSTALTEQGPIVETQPVYYQGIIIDYDDEALYLGQKAGIIDQMILRSQIVDIKIFEEPNELDEILDNFSPERNEDVN